MHLIAHLRTFLFEYPNFDTDRLRRAGYYDGEPRPRHRRHWANR